LLIVVAIILIIADIAIPNLLRAKIAANQASAVGSLRTMSSAEETFSSTFSDGYALTLAQLGGPAGSQGCKNAGLIDEVLVDGSEPEERLCIHIHAQRHCIANRRSPIGVRRVG
jgi:hypothetical protein